MKFKFKNPKTGEEEVIELSNETIRTHMEDMARDELHCGCDFKTECNCIEHYEKFDLVELSAEENPDTKFLEMLEWADENLWKAECITSSIADTGDYDSQWSLEDYEKRMSYGYTLIDAIKDAMKDDEDPTRYTYVPPEHRTP